MLKNDNTVLDREYNKSFKNLLEGLDKSDLDLPSLVKAFANDQALYELAISKMPEDVKEWGQRHNLPTVTEYWWIIAFMSGWHTCTLSIAAREKANESHNS